MVNKYRNQKVTTGNESYRSKLEAAVHQTLIFREKAGEIEVVRREVNVFLTKARILYIADFQCFDKASGVEFYVEAKGFEGPRWPTIKKLWRFYGPGRLEIWKGSYSKPFLDEVIESQKVEE